MLMGIMSLACFHVVCLVTVRDGAEITDYLHLARGSACPFCSATVTQTMLVCDTEELHRMRQGALHRPAGSAPAPRARMPAFDARQRAQCEAATEASRPTVALQVATEAVGRGDDETARNAFTVCSESGDDEKAQRAEFGLGELEDRRGALPDAAYWYRRAAGRGETPVRSAALAYLGVALARMNDVDGAIDAYQRCIATTTPARGLAAFRLAQIYEELGQLDRAREGYRSAMAMHERLGSADAAVRLGSWEADDGRWDAARELWEYAFASTSEQARCAAAFNLGQWERRRGDLGRARSMFRIAAQSDLADVAARARSELAEIE